MPKEQRKNYLVLNNNLSHPDIKRLIQVKQVFFFPKTTGKIKPKDAGIICCLQFYYRKNLAEMHCLALKNSLSLRLLCTTLSRPRKT